MRSDLNIIRSSKLEEVRVDKAPVGQSGRGEFIKYLIGDRITTRR